MAFTRRRVVTSVWTLLVASFFLLVSADSHALGPQAYSQVSVGESHTCALLAIDGGIECWGLNGVGQLGNGTQTSSSSPVRVSGITGALEVAAGSRHTCALLTGGAVRCWGFGGTGQTGDGGYGVRLTPVTVVGVTGAVSVAVGTDHGCAALADGTVKCWGQNYEGQLGDGGNGYTATATVATGLNTAVKVVAGLTHTCALTSAGTAYCWGNGSVGQLGRGSTANSRVPVLVTGISNAGAISGGNLHNCALLNDGVGSVFCWGYNNTGQLGDGTLSASLVPKLIVSGAASVGAGLGHTCVTAISGEAACWGLNQFGQLGDGTLQYSLTPIYVTGITNATGRIAASGYNSCVIVVGGALRCWGSNAYGQLGDGVVARSATPVAVVGISGATSVSTGQFHGCAVVTGGGVRCWGANNSGDLGTGAAGLVQSNTSLAIPGLVGVTRVVSGDAFNCALMTDTTVRCWGLNNSGTLGNGTTANSDVPVTVIGLSAVTQLSAQGNTVCAIRSGGGTVWCWGDNRFGQLGVSGVGQSATPVQVPGVGGASAVAVGGFHSCALLAAGDMKCWGSNIAGQIGNGSAGGVLPPTTVGTPTGSSSVTGATAIGVADNNSCAVIAGGVKCWGNNSEGQLGSAAPTVSLVPILVPGISNAVAVSGALFHFCALISDGTVKCWGSGTLGETGSAGSAPLLTPTTVPGLTGVSSVATGREFTCAQLGSGGMRCFGANGYAQLGDGTTPYPSGLQRAVLPGTCSLDIDGDGSVNAATDGLLLIRASFGITGSAAMSGAVGANAVRRSWDDVGPYLKVTCKVGSAAPPGACSMDIDGDGAVRGTTDGLLLLRAVLGLPGTVVTQGTISSTATRRDWTAIRNYLANTCGLTGLAP